MTDDEWLAQHSVYRQVLLAVFPNSPANAAINGHALVGGLELLLSDWAYASRGAMMAFQRLGSACFGHGWHAHDAAQGRGPSRQTRHFDGKVLYCRRST